MRVQARRGRRRFVTRSRTRACEDRDVPAVSVDAARPVREPGSGWRGAGLRPVLTVLSTGLVALVSALLLWLGWLLVGGVANAVPALPPGSRVRVGGLVVPASRSRPRR